MATVISDPNLKTGLIKWCEQNNVTITDLAAALQYSYQGAWNIIRGDFPVSIETIGRFAVGYGPTKLDEWFDLAGFPAKVQQ